MIYFTLYHQLYSILCRQPEEKTLTGWTTAQAERPAYLQSGGTLDWSQIESSQGCLPWSHQAGLLTSHGDLLVRSTGLNKGSLTSSLFFFLPLTRSSGCFCIWWKNVQFFFFSFFTLFGCCRLSRQAGVNVSYQQCPEYKVERFWIIIKMFYVHRQDCRSITRHPPTSPIFGPQPQQKSCWGRRWRLVLNSVQSAQSGLSVSRRLIKRKHLLCCDLDEFHQNVLDICLHQPWKISVIFSCLLWCFGESL